MSHERLDRLTKFLLTRDRAAVIEVRASAAGGDAEKHLRGAIAELPPIIAAPEAVAAGAYKNRVSITRFTLPNGLTVILAPRYFTPLVHARMILPVGSIHSDNPALPVYAARALDPPSDGRGRYGSAGILFRTPLADFGSSVDAFTTSFEATAITGWQDVVVWGMARIMEDGQYDRVDLGRVVMRGRRALSGPPSDDDRRRQKVSRWWLEAIWGGGHPVVTAAPITEARVARVTYDQVKAWRAAHYRPAGAVLLVTGNFSASFLRRHIEVAFARWNGGQAGTAGAPAAPAGIKRLAVISERDTHVSVNLELPLRQSSPADEAAALVAAELLDERMLEVREKLAAAYHLDAVVLRRPLAPAIELDGQIDGGFADQVFPRIATAIAELRGGAFDDAAIERARRRAVRAARARQAIGDHVEADIVRALLRGGGLDDDAAVVTALEEVDAGALRRGVVGVLSGGERVMIEGPRPLVTRAFNALGGPADTTID
jgi:hypothetical protein